LNIAINTRLLIKDKLEGIGRFTFEIFSRVALENPQHHFFFLFDRKPDDSFLVADNITPLIVQPPCRHPFLYFIWFEYSIPKVLKKHNIELFISTDNFLSLKTKVPTILVLHDLAYKYYPKFVKPVYYKYYNHFTPKFVAKAQHIVTVSSFVKNDVSKHFNIDKNKISVIGNSYRNIDKNKTLTHHQDIKTKYTDGREYFLYVGAIHPRKNLKNILLAFDTYKKNNDSSIKLLIVGRNAWKTDEIGTLYKQLTFKDDILFNGYTSDDELIHIITVAKALLYPSLHEGFGIPILEALQCSTPVITSNITSMPEVGRNAAIFVNPNLPSSIENAMKMIESQPEFVENIVSNAQQVLERYNWDEQAIKFSDLIEKFKNKPKQ
jgi:glycosyltransferase involved in cell wall biosynthesis